MRQLRSVLSLLITIGGLVVLMQFFWVTACDAAQSSDIVGPVQLQKQVKLYLNELDNLRFDGKALFADQSSENICRYYMHYLHANWLLERFGTNLNGWKKLIEQSYNDKIYHVYAATVQLAMGSIYHRREEFLGFLNLDDILKKKNLTSECVITSNPGLKAWASSTEKKIEETGGYDEINSEWMVKEERLLTGALDSIKKALDIDPNYKDALIAKAQYMVMTKKYENAKKIFDQLENDGWFKDERSFLFSWKSYISISERQGVEPALESESKIIESDTGQTSSWLWTPKKLLREAAAFEEPSENSEWASKYRSKINQSEKSIVDFKFDKCSTVANVDLMMLKKYTKYLIKKLRFELQRPIQENSGLPKNYTLDKKAETYFDKYPNVLLALDTDSTENNLARYRTIIENIYKASVIMEQVIDQWDRLANQNPENSYYYLMYKIICEERVLEALNITQAAVDNSKLNDYLKRKQEDLAKSRKNKNITENDIIDYAFVWSETIQNLKMKLPRDISRMQSANNSYLPGKLLAFEYKALVDDPQEALKSLSDIEKDYEKYMVTVFKDSAEDWDFFKGLILCDDCKDWHNRKNWDNFSDNQIWQNWGSDSVENMDELKLYFAAWKSYLLYKGNNIKEAKNYLYQANYFNQMAKWRDDMDKIITLKEHGSSPKAK